MKAGALFATIAAAAGLHASAAAAFSDCDTFRNRMSQAERQLHLILPDISFSFVGTNKANGLREYELRNIKSFDVELFCTGSGAVNNFSITQEEADDHALPRFTGLSQAALWAYTGWPPQKVTAALSKLLIEAGADAEANRIRGEEADNGGALLELTDDVDVKVSGGRSFGLAFMIDASTAK